MTDQGREVSSMWDRLLRRKVLRYPDGRTQLIGFSVGAAIRWHRRHYGARPCCPHYEEPST